MLPNHFQAADAKSYSRDALSTAEDIIEKLSKMQKLMTVSSGSFAVSSSSSTSTAGTKRNKDSDSEGEEEDEERKRRKRELSPIKADGELGKMGEGRSIEFNLICFFISR